MKRLGHALDEYINVWGRFTFLLPFALLAACLARLPDDQAGLLSAGASPSRCCQTLSTMALSKALKLVADLAGDRAVEGEPAGPAGPGLGDDRRERRARSASPACCSARPASTCSTSTARALALVGAAGGALHRPRPALHAARRAVLRAVGHHHQAGDASPPTPSMGTLGGYLAASLLMTPIVLATSRRHFAAVAAHWKEFVALGLFAALTTISQGHGLHADAVVLRGGGEAGRDPLRDGHRRPGLRRGPARPRIRPRRLVMLLGMVLLASRRDRGWGLEVAPPMCARGRQYTTGVEERHGFAGALRACGGVWGAMSGPPTSIVRPASAWRRRWESVARMLWVSSGASFRSVVKSRRLMTSMRSGVSAMTLAERGPPSSRLISPKYCPGPSRERFRAETSTRALPSRIRKKSLPAAPVRASTRVGGDLEHLADLRDLAKLLARASLQQADFLQTRDAIVLADPPAEEAPAQRLAARVVGNRAVEDAADQFHAGLRLQPISAGVDRGAPGARWWPGHRARQRRSRSPRP